MDLEPYVDSVRTQLAAVARAGGEGVHQLADLLSAALDSAVRLAILDVLGAAAAEITSELAPGAVDLRLRGREPGFVLTLPPSVEPDDSSTAVPMADADDAPTARINVRMSEDLKASIEAAARNAGLSVNAWLVRAAATGLGTAPPGSSRRRGSHGSDGFTGWIR